MPGITHGWTAPALVLGLLLAGCEPEAQAPEASPPPVGTEVGERAPPLNGTDQDGGSWTFEPERSEYTLLEFYRSGSCGLCRLRLTELERYRDYYQQASAGVYVVSPEPAERLPATLDAVESDGPAVAVERADLVAWDVIESENDPVNPASYLVDRDGVIRYRHLGRNAGDRASDVEILAVIRQDRQRREMAGR